MTTDTNPPSRRFRRIRGEIAFCAVSVIWAVVTIDTGAGWPVAMWITTALIPFSIHRNRTDSAASDSSKGTPR